MRESDELASCRPSAVDEGVVGGMGARDGARPRKSARRDAEGPHKASRDDGRSTALEREERVEREIRVSSDAFRSVRARTRREWVRFPRGNGLGRWNAALDACARGGAGSVIEAIESKPLLKSALVCAGLGCVGDTVAQRRGAGGARGALTAKGKAGKGKQPPAASDAHDFQRTLKQALYNFFSRTRAASLVHRVGGQVSRRAFAHAESLAPFGAKVFLNKAVLGPLVVTTFFLWGAVWSGDVSNYPAKVRRDGSRPSRVELLSPPRASTSPWCRRVTKSCTCPRVPSCGTLF